MRLVYTLLVAFAIIARTESTCETFGTCYNVRKVLSHLEEHSCHGSRLVRTQSSYLASGTEHTRLGEIVRHVKSFFPTMDFALFQSCLPGNYTWDYLCKPATIPCDGDSYRSHDGTCNNLDHPDWGAIGTEQLQLLEPVFDDGHSSPRSRGVDGEPLPSPRDVSNNIFYEIHPDEDPKFTMWVWAFGQLVDHDITLTPVLKDKAGEEIFCCDDEHKLECGSVCAPIPIPEDDPHFSKTGQTCMNFVRSVSSPCCSADCTRTPINRISAVMDGTPTYGNSDTEAGELREDQPNGEKGAKLKVTHVHHLEGGLLPRASDQTRCDDGGQAIPFCSKSGDVRHHVAPSLTSTITMFHREHNRIVDKLRELNNPGWDEERLYQEARKIVMAEYQKLTMDELGVVLGKRIMNLFGLHRVEGYHDTYNKSINPQISLPFSTAAYRFGHSLVNIHQGQRNRDNDQTIVEDVAHNHFNRANLTMYKDAVSGVLRYLGHKCMGKADGHINPEIRNLLFVKDGISLDLGSLNIMRGRDHGLPPYNAWRRYFNLPEFPYSHTPETAGRLLELYDHKPENIDLYAGGLSEVRIDTLVGSTFAHIIGEQFWRLKAGDRYHFQNRPDLETTVGRFKSEAQVKSIQTMTLARIICANTETVRIQPNVFLKAGPGNELVYCSDLDAIPDMDFNHWRETGDYRG